MAAHLPKRSRPAHSWHTSSRPEHVHGSAECLSARLEGEWPARQACRDRIPSDGGDTRKNPLPKPDRRRHGSERTRRPKVVSHAFSFAKVATTRAFSSLRFSVVCVCSARRTLSRSAEVFEDTATFGEAISLRKKRPARARARHSATPQDLANLVSGSD